MEQAEQFAARLAESETEKYSLADQLAEVTLRAEAAEAKLRDIMARYPEVV